MPLPAYLTNQPTANPTDIVARQIERLGLDATVTRAGSTITIRDLELSPDNGDRIDRALRLITSHADAHRLAADAIVYPVQGNVIEKYLAAGFLIHVEPSNDDDEDAHTLLHRTARQ